ncbi:hypothetical protein PN498_16095 [Oscillatoria sp. CS-180]|uniref:hypothetical protein n=1 Tax=Oscillatoria sp. CS-180 TaxID=3021720 RepID=UPI00232EFC6A|nr:hypothetical protein [Oscillatoria sp. CS-180]MDB9527520.1 hypothetical protein [Oscillatoria sp. CS-180]
MPEPCGYRERFFFQLKHSHPNAYAIYLMISIVSIWSGSWYLADTWASGQDLLAPVSAVAPVVAAKHLFLLVLGLTMLYIDDQSLDELVLMRTSRLKPIDRRRGQWGKAVVYLKRHYPNLIAVYTYIGIILSWCGTWGLLWDIPIQPFWRSWMTIALGFLMLYVDDLKLTEV